MVESKQQHADEKEADKLSQHDGPASQEGSCGAFGPISAKVALDQILICSVRAHRKEAATNQTSPKSECRREVEREIENGKFVELRARRHRGR